MRRPWKQFAEFIEQCGFPDLPMSSGNFTLMSNKETNSYSRLDCFLLSIEILEAYLNIHQICLPRSISDHNLVALNMEETNWGLKPVRL